MHLKSFLRILKRISEIDVPADILMVSTTIKPKYQEAVYQEEKPFIFEAAYDDKTCRQILEMLSEKYDWSEEEDKRYLGNGKRLGYYSVLMAEWIQSKPLNIMIQSTIRYHEKNKILIPINNNPSNLEAFSIKKVHHINHVINELLKDVENILRFKVKNYVINYLKLTRQDAGDWHNYLEYGTSGFESIPRTRFVRIFSRFQRVSISSFRPAVKPKPFDR